MIGSTQDLRRLPAVSFTPVTPSSYRIRRQPRPQYYSTIEAIHQVIELFAPDSPGRGGDERPHDNLLAVFGALVERQLTYTPLAGFLFIHSDGAYAAGFCRCDYHNIRIQ